MATAFTEREREEIFAKLKQAAWECAVSVGMRKTTVEQLAKAAGISKGAFYLFYASKELLFFEILEEYHTELYGAAQSAFDAHAGLPPHARATAAILAACRLAATDSPGLVFMEEIPVLLRKIPQEVLHAHYHSDEAHIAEMIRRFHISLTVPEAHAVAAVWSIFFLLPHRREIGDSFDSVLELMVRGVCRQMVSDV